MSLSALYHGDQANARVYCDQALAVARSLHPLYVGVTLVNKCNVLMFQDQFEQAETLAGESAEIAKKYGDSYTAANAIGNQGAIDLELGRYHEAKELLDEALATFRSLGDERGAATVEGSLGNYHNRIGEYGAASESYQRVAATAERLHDPVMAATVESYLGKLSRETGDPAAAQRHFDRAIAGGREIGFGYLLADALHDSADLCFSLGRSDQARDLNTEALAIADGMGRIEMQLRCGLLDARLTALRDPGAALAQLGKLSRRHQRPENTADIAYEMFRITKANDQRERAAGLYAGLFAATPRISYRTRRDELLQET
jgi:tetratricopeptide (TPR) repeat protein